LGLITYSKVEHYVAKPRNRAVRVIRLALKLVGFSCTSLAPNLRVWEKFRETCEILFYGNLG